MFIMQLTGKINLHPSIMHAHVFKLSELVSSVKYTYL